MHETPVNLQMGKNNSTKATAVAESKAAKADSDHYLAISFWNSLVFTHLQGTFTTGKELIDS